MIYFTGVGVESPRSLINHSVLWNLGCSNLTSIDKETMNYEDIVCWKWFIRCCRVAGGQVTTWLELGRRGRWRTWRHHIMNHRWLPSLTKRRVSVLYRPARLSLCFYRVGFDVYYSISRDEGGSGLSISSRTPFIICLPEERGTK